MAPFQGDLPLSPLWKTGTLPHLILPILLPCFIFPLSLITTRYYNYIFVYCLLPCLLVVHRDLFVLSSWTPGFSASNYISLFPLWLGRTTWLRFLQRYVCNTDVWNSLVIFLKKLALDPSLLAAGTWEPNAEENRTAPLAWHGMTSWNRGGLTTPCPGLVHAT